MLRSGNKPFFRALGVKCYSFFIDLRRNNRLMQPTVLNAVVFDYTDIGFAKHNLCCELFVFQPEHVGDVLKGIALEIELVDLPYRFGVAVRN